MEGVTELYAHDPEVAFWKKVKFIITRMGNWTLISPKDKEQLLLLLKSYPRFLGEGRQWRSCDNCPQACRKESDSGLLDPSSDSESEEEIKAEACAAHLEGINFDERNS